MNALTDSIKRPASRLLRNSHTACSPTAITARNSGRRMATRLRTIGLHVVKARVLRFQSLRQPLLRADEWNVLALVDDAGDLAPPRVALLRGATNDVLDEVGVPVVSNALGYAKSQEQELRNVLLDGRLPLHDTRSERALGTIVVGRKNWLFHGSDVHAEAAAGLFSSSAASA
jgi:hypothetical protein